MNRESERKRIRKKIVEVLKAADIPGVGEDVFSQTSIDSDTDELPVINVYILSEPVSRNDQTPKTYQRNLSIQLEIQTTHDNDELLMDELDDLSQLVENALEGTNELYDMKDATNTEDLINDYDLANTAYETEGNGSSPIGSVKINYNFEYYTNEDRAPVLDEFDRFETQYNANGNTDGDAKEISELD